MKEAYETWGTLLSDQIHAEQEFQNMKKREKLLKTYLTK
jgi:hypothetical protein